MLSLLLAVPSCIYSFWHGVIPTSYFIFILVIIICSVETGLSSQKIVALGQSLHNNCLTLIAVMIIIIIIITRVSNFVSLYSKYKVIIKLKKGMSHIYISLCRRNDLVQSFLLFTPFLSHRGIICGVSNKLIPTPMWSLCHRIRLFNTAAIASESVRSQRQQQWDSPCGSSSKWADGRALHMRDKSTPHHRYS